MVRAAVIIVYFLIYALLLLTAARRTELISAYDAEARDAAAELLAAGVSNYRIETGSYPASLTALGAAPGYEYLRSIQRAFQNMALVNNLSDGSFQYSRVVLYSFEDYNPTQTDTTFLAAANNVCGAGGFTTAAEWCAPSNADTRWWKQESREIIANDLQRERRRLTRLLAKFNAWYNDDTSVSTTNGVWGNNYPNPGAASATLISLVGYVQTAKTCSGIYTWRRIPIDCTDLYSVWGTPTVYNYISPTHIVLLTQTPFTKADGTPLYISTEESL